MPSLLRSFGFLVGASLMVTAAACAGGNSAALVKAPDFAPRDQTKCGVEKRQARPLIVEWPSSDRRELETEVRRGLVAVRYVGCEMEVLPRCRVAEQYSYLAETRKVDQVVMRDADDLYANLPVGAAMLESKLEHAGQLTVEMNLVGRYEAARSTVSADELQGDCAGATHFVYAITVGAFDFFAGGEAAAGGSVRIGEIGAASTSKSERERLTADGDVAACERSSPDDKGPPANCDALVRIEVVPLAAAQTRPTYDEVLTVLNRDLHKRLSEGLGSDDGATAQEDEFREALILAAERVAREGNLEGARSALEALVSKIELQNPDFAHRSPTSLSGPNDVETVMAKMCPGFWPFC
jgi:hypothetical protein